METGRNRLECRTCPYEHPIEQTIYSRRNFARVEKEDVFGGPGAWDNAPKQRVQCGNPACNGDEAAYFSVQIRSADEPMTVSFPLLMRRRRTVGFADLGWNRTFTSV